MTKLGKIVFTLVVLLLAGFAVMRMLGKKDGDTGAPGSPAHADTREMVVPEGDSNIAASFDFIAPGKAQPLPSPRPYTPVDSTIAINLSEYAGYAGLIAANGGLEPNDASWFAKNGGFKLKITLSEEDSWADLQDGKFAATATTVDVLSNYGRQWQCVVPAQVSWSRGADGIIVKKDIKRVNDLKGKTIATAPFSEAEFFIRYLAQEAGLAVVRLDGPEQTRNPEAVNLVFLEDAFEAGDAFLADLKAGGHELDGCVTWAPKTTEVVEGSEGAARQLIDNRNLLVIADILVFNKGFAQAKPEVVQKIVEGMLLHNDRIRANPESHLKAIADAFKAYEWTVDDAREELSKVHLSNLPENLAFFRGAIDEAGSFASVFQTANLAYGSELQPSPVAASFFADIKPLEAIAAAGTLSAQVASIQPIKTNDQAPIEQDPLLTRDIRFYFLPNSAQLDMGNKENHDFLANVNHLLGVSPGSMILLRGHVDDAQKENFRKQGGEALVRKMFLKAMELSQQRADEVKKRLLEKYPAIKPDRLEVVGRGWEEPAGKDSDLNRRVEVQWFTVE
ncbi:phosphate ABC transporter substrate-binding/OmpA family protein [Luteolibacter arcticus]|uniref:Phosphate ABC transporter substrate-binding/OmpA family protein n=1 Tax=Luteolibacter arcticus TaxID=1581411 RepID=A0ABT3GH91_9BACT|nr:phosphate ABC transporter substrate-binding/OmpA family protein [Luteolibacter arcticus]MCW1922404.1 phosphate ABC transporter substrate-binding/OmpA family protein [Luteolibacter arcticus]